MSNATTADVFVLLCDWRGHCNWCSAADWPLPVGAYLWEPLTSESQETTKRALGRTVTLREQQSLEVQSKNNNRFRVWLFPLDSPEMAVCALGRRIPNDLSRLTERERQCLELLAQGLETSQLAQELDVSLSTVHTYIKRAREKLDLDSLEALIAFAGRYCYPANKALGAPARAAGDA